MTQVDRRQFLQIILTSLVASSVGSPVLAGGRQGDPATGSASQWYPDLESARELGRIYLEDRPDRNDLDALEKQLFNNPSQGPLGRPSSEMLTQTIPWIAEGENHEICSTHHGSRRGCGTC